MPAWDLDSENGGSTDSATGDTQSKSLIANTYSDVQHQENGDLTYKYKDISDWGVNADLAYQLTKAGGAMREFASSRDYSDREEWYSALQIALGHILADAPDAVTGAVNARNTFEEFGVDPRGASEVMEFLGLDLSDIVQYLSDAPDFVEMDVQEFAPVLDQNREFAQELFEVLSQTDWVEESAEASADD